MLPECELPDLSACLLLPEDVALRNLPPLKNAHKRFDFEQDRPTLTEVEEVSGWMFVCFSSLPDF